MRTALPASLSARLFPFTPACPRQYTHRSLRRWMSTIDAFQSGLPIPLFTFCSKLIESVRMRTCVVRLSPLETIQRRAWVTASTSIVKLEVELAVLHTSCVNSGQSDVWQMEQWLRTFPWSRKLRVGSRESSREQSTSIWHRRNAEELSCHSHLNDFYVKEENSTRGRQR